MNLTISSSNSARRSTNTARYLQKSESSTRYCLIDPLLTALGWDLSDPAQVLTEYNSGNGRADYALAPGSGPPSLVVEAKSLFTPTAQGIAQSINYCLQDGIEVFRGYER